MTHSPPPLPLPAPLTWKVREGEDRAPKGSRCGLSRVRFIWASSLLSMWRPGRTCVSSPSAFADPRWLMEAPRTWSVPVWRVIARMAPAALVPSSLCMRGLASLCSPVPAPSMCAVRTGSSTDMLSPCSRLIHLSSVLPSDAPRAVKGLNCSSDVWRFAALTQISFFLIISLSFFLL